MRQLKKVLIDTDLGDDIDDAFALCLAMQSPEIEVLGVTTVFKSADKRARMAKKLLTLGGFGFVPVVEGEHYPLNQKEMFKLPINFDEPPISYDPAEYDDVEYDGNDAVEFLRRTLENSEEKLILVTLGALTNIARLFQKYPQTKDKVSELVVMGGAFDMNFPEYNYSCDPEAADFVINCGLPVKAVGVDVTFKCATTAEQTKALEECPHPAIKLLMSMRQNPAFMIYLHDPLALMSVYNDEYLTFCQRVVKVETTGEYTRGMAVNMCDHNWRRDCSVSPLVYARQVRADEFTADCIYRLLRFGK